MKKMVSDCFCGLLGPVETLTYNFAVVVGASECVVPSGLVASTSKLVGSKCRDKAESAGENDRELHG